MSTSSLAKAQGRQLGYKTKAAPTNAPAEATRVPTRLVNEKGTESAIAALVLVAEDVGDAEEAPLDAGVEAAVDTGLVELAAAMSNWSREGRK